MTEYLLSDQEELIKQKNGEIYPVDNQYLIILRNGNLLKLRDIKEFEKNVWETTHKADIKQAIGIWRNTYEQNKKSS